MAKTKEWVCPTCGTSVDGDIGVCWKCRQAGRPDSVRADIPSASGDLVEAEADEQRTSTLFDASELPPQENASILRRYQDGYRVAKLINGFGHTCKVVGIILGGLIVLGCAMAASESSFAAVTVPIGLVVGSILGFIGWAVGVMISALGQIVKATLDTAVNSSPFLSNEERAQIMSLP
jgi:hypothetical protein